MHCFVTSTLFTKILTVLNTFRSELQLHGKKFGAAAAFVVVALPHHGFNAAAAPLLRQR